MHLLNTEVDAAHFLSANRLLLLLAAQRDIAVLERREGGRRGALVPRHHFYGKGGTSIAPFRAATITFFTSSFST